MYVDIYNIEKYVCMYVCGRSEMNVLQCMLFYRTRQDGNVCMVPDMEGDDDDDCDGWKSCD